jgi:hypothetical protein
MKKFFVAGMLAFCAAVTAQAGTEQTVQPTAIRETGDSFARGSKELQNVTGAFFFFDTTQNQRPAIDFAIDVLPTPGGPMKRRIGPFAIARDFASTLSVIGRSPFSPTASDGVAGRRRHDCRSCLRARSQHRTGDRRARGDGPGGRDGDGR